MVEPWFLFFLVEVDSRQPVYFSTYRHDFPVSGETNG